MVKKGDTISDKNYHFWLNKRDKIRWTKDYFWLA